MRLHYSGPVDRVSLPLPNGGHVEVAKGHDIDLSDHMTAKEAAALGRSLLDQDTWTEAKPAAKSDDKKED
ncbi:hypothetical protein [Miltoncostaea oceani]|uniref:hypothetical protein n=1 Tax=Miltoncostaea oceani TaxID=2843216 RepID=UPI001C3C976B|nr:hypothetical protein [Miltoncostaea oceani]